MGKGAETRERILDQAVRLASRDGMEGLTIGTLSSELGLSKSGLFAHFGSKDELQLQVLQAAVELFERNVIRPALTARTRRSSGTAHAGAADDASRTGGACDAGGTS